MRKPKPKIAFAEIREPVGSKPMTQKQRKHCFWTLYRHMADLPPATLDKCEQVRQVAGKNENVLEREVREIGLEVIDEIREYRLGQTPPEEMAEKVVSAIGR